jgi:hypothetical protein
LNFYSIVSGQYNNVLENQIDTLDGGFSLPREMFWPEKYSADGSKLVLTLGYYEGASAAIYYPNGNALSVEGRRRRIHLLRRYRMDS